jgi:hypothetical protein
MDTNLVVTSTEASGGHRTLEASHRSVSSFDPAMVLLNPIVQILDRPVFHAFVQFGTDRARMSVATVTRNECRNDAGHRLVRSKERLRRRHVAWGASGSLGSGDPGPIRRNRSNHRRTDTPGTTTSRSKWPPLNSPSRPKIPAIIPPQLIGLAEYGRAESLHQSYVNPSAMNNSLPGN